MWLNQYSVSYSDGNAESNDTLQWLNP